MYETFIITSLQNARVKDVCRLQEKSQERRRTGRFVVEGRRELQRCVAAGYEVETLVLCAELAERLVIWSNSSEIVTTVIGGAYILWPTLEPRQF